MPALIDNKGRMALSHSGHSIVTKPHGHGDIHHLLYKSGQVKKWADEGREWVLFI